MLCYDPRMGPSLAREIRKSLQALVVGCILLATAAAVQADEAVTATLARLANAPVQALETYEDDCNPRRTQAYAISFGLIIDTATPSGIVRTRDASGTSHWSGHDATVQAADLARGVVGALGGAEFLGQMISSAASRYTSTVSDAGVVTGMETGGTQDMAAAGMHYPPLTGKIGWQGKETLDLASGQDDWQFEARLLATYHHGRTGKLCHLTATLTAQGTAKRKVLLLSQASAALAPPPSVLAAMPDNLPLPARMHFCGQRCFTLTLKGKHYEAVVDGSTDGAVASTYEVELFTPQSVILHRDDGGAQSAVLSGQLSKERDSVVAGKLRWVTGAAAGSEFPYDLAWGASFDKARTWAQHAGNP